MKYFHLITLLLLFACKNESQDISTGPLSGTMDDLVTRFYESFEKPTLDTISDAFIHEYISPSEKEVLSTRYWNFEVDVPVTVSIMRDKDQQTIPFWLAPSGFEKTALTVKNSHSTYEVWQKKFNQGSVDLGINGFDKHRPVYFVGVAPQNERDEVTITPIFPENQHIETFDVGAFTYHDWDGLTLTEVPDQLKGHQLLTTIRGRAREAHLIGAFRNSDFPSSTSPDQVMLTWSGEPSTTVDIQWRTAPEIQSSQVRYWKAENSDTLTQSGNAKIMEDRLLENDRYIQRYTANLSGLTPGTTYQYQVGSDQGVWTDAETFKTAAQSPSPFSFVWFGDVHNTDTWGDLIHQADEKHPDNSFYIIAGDLVNTGLHRDDWDQLFGYAGKTISRRPLMAVPGNHDSQDGLGAWMYEDMFSFPDNGPDGFNPERTYSFTYQNALYLMLDATLPNAPQTAWMEKVLQENTSDWVFVVTHFPPYNAVEPYETLIEEWVPVFDKYSVDMVMGGHFHYYMRSKPLVDSKISSDPSVGTRYVISIGTKGKNKEAPKGEYADVQFEAEFLYQHMEIDGKKLRYTSYNLDGEVVDQFSIEK
ncbi:purple acid phosphatase family protein [Lunatibacter salilacus]|uniref:purple acid phosphatase family protein n=1 Tax=Lunatibacter salilacus TaxID=2483804 RepID=UPI00131DAF3B|nr:metallophosphoesterase family protein [Lunatibacter salilacus]